MPQCGRALACRRRTIDWQFDNAVTVLPEDRVGGARNMNRPKKATRIDGKRRNKNYQQLTAYVPKETHTAVKLVSIKTGQEISELVQSALAQFLDPQPAPPAYPWDPHRDAAVQQAILVAERELGTDNPKLPLGDRLSLRARFGAEWAKRLVDGVEESSRRHFDRRQTASQAMGLPPEP